MSTINIHLRSLGRFAHRVLGARRLRRVCPPVWRGESSEFALVANAGSGFRTGGRPPRGRAGLAVPVPALLAFVTALAAGSREASAQDESVCDRTVQVRNAIEAASGGVDCARMTEHHLREITALDLSEHGIVSLRDGDFDGLVRLETLDLSRNPLTELPAGVFDQLYLLKSLRLHDSALQTLPDGIFDELFLLEELSLDRNGFTSLPEELFEDLSRFAGIQADGSPPDNAGPYPRLQRFLDRHDVNSPEEFVGALPPMYLQRFVLMLDSESPARLHVSGEHPRVISWGADGEFIFAWNTDPDASTEFRESVRFLRQDELAWSAGVIDFSRGNPEITEPASCQSCHGSLGKPLWGEWNTWRGSEYRHPNAAEYYPEAEQQMRSARQSTDPRLEPLDFAASSLEGAETLRALNLPGQVPHVFAAQEAGGVWSWRHAEILFRRLKQRSADFQALSEAVFCGADIGSRFPVLRFFDHGEHNLGVSADVKVTTDRYGAIITPQHNDLISVGYSYHAPGNIPGAVKLLLLADLWEREEMIRHLYRTTRNDLTLPSYTQFADTLLYYPSGSATAEDELIQKLRIHFGRGGMAGLETRGRQNQRFYLGGLQSANFWEGHLVPMRSRICSALRGSQPGGLRAGLEGADAVLNWYAPAYAPAALTGYRIRRSGGPNGAEVLEVETASTATAWIDQNAPPGANTYTVTALYDHHYASRASESVVVTVPNPLTVRAEQTPVRHNGSSTVFTFEIHFSEEVAISAQALRDWAFETTVCRVQNVRRQSPSSSRSWYIDVEPESDRRVRVALPAGRACDVRGAICTAGGKRLSNRLDVLVPGRLTASAENVPRSHDGRPFRFSLSFSEEVDLSPAILRDQSFDVTGGSITGARRHASSSNLLWEITVSPEAGQSVGLVLENDRPCGTAGAICTADGERLSNRLEIIVPARQ